MERPRLLLDMAEEIAVFGPEICGVVWVGVVMSWCVNDVRAAPRVNDVCENRVGEVVFVKSASSCGQSL